MIRVTVMYPNAPGAHFDHDYYREQHMPLVKAVLGGACEYYTVERGLSGRAPDEPPAFVAMCSFVCGSAEAYRAAMQDRGSEVLNDLANYTDITPVVQFSEVVVERSHP